MKREELARMLDHTQVRAYATQTDITELCDEAVEYGLHAVAVNPAWTSYCAKQLAGTDVGIVVTIGFPLGATTAHIKVEETTEAVRNGATELDMVVNIGAVKSGFPSFAEREIAAVVKAAKDVPVKVILETSFLTLEEKICVLDMSIAAGASFVKTASGFGEGGATATDVRVLSKAAEGRIGVKAAGGIRTLTDVLEMIDAGATRIGTSASTNILDALAV